VEEDTYMEGELSVSAFTQALGSNAPTPGGGAASALVGALAAALAEMVARFTVGRARYREVEPQAQAIVEQAEQARIELLALVAADERAFQAVSAAYAQPRASDEERQARDATIQAALLAAMQPPLSALRLALAVARLARDIAEIGNATVLTDAACAGAIAEAAARASALNVLANAALLHDGAAATPALGEARAACAEATNLRDATLAIVYRRMGVEGI
jgi:formiminotetrahydrofolate cyclodeaminase